MPKSVINTKINFIFNNVNYLSSLFFKFIGPAIGVLILYVISSRYDQNGVGFYGSLMQVITILSVLVRSGSDYVIIKSVPNRDAAGERDGISRLIVFLIIRIILVFITAYTVMYFLAGMADVELMHYLKNNYASFGLALGCFSLFSFLVSFLVAINRPLQSILFQSVCLPICTLVFLMVLPVDFKYLMLSVGLASLILLTVILIKFTTAPEIIMRAPLQEVLKALQETRLTGFVNGFSNSFSEVVLFNSDILILALFVDLSHVAAYTMSSRLVVFYGLYVQLQNSFFSSAVSQLSSCTAVADAMELRSVFRRVVLMNFLFLILYAVFLKFSVFFIIYFFGDAYLEIKRYVAFLGIAGYAGVMFGFSVNFYFLLMDRGNVRGGLRNFVCLLCYLVLMVCLCYGYGIWGTIAAIVILKFLYYSFYFILSLREINRRIIYAENLQED